MQVLRLKKQDFSRIDYLKEVNLFAEIRDNPEALNHLASLMEDRVIKKGEYVLHEGEASTEMFILTGGEASVYKSTTERDLYKVAILKGSHPVFFGEGALLDAETRSATIQADSDCHCLVLNRADFEKFGNQFPQWALPILQRIARGLLVRLRKSNDDMTLLYNALVAEIRGK